MGEGACEVPATVNEQNHLETRVVTTLAGSVTADQRALDAEHVTTLTARLKNGERGRRGDDAGDDIATVRRVIRLRFAVVELKDGDRLPLAVGRVDGRRGEETRDEYAVDHDY